MATQSLVTNNEKSNIIVITGNDQTLENILSIIQKSENDGQLNGITKHVTSEPIKDIRKTLYKGRKSDLTCVICANKCCGYNFNVICCASCKSFFHRNISQNLNDLKCLTNTNKCNITFNNRRQICRRCRLEKCLSVGMKRNTVDQQEKLNKKRLTEENRRLSKSSIRTSIQSNIVDVSFNENEQSTNEPNIVFESQKVFTVDQLQTTQSRPGEENGPTVQNHFLSLDDYNRLNSVKLSYEKACGLPTSKCDVSGLARIFDQRSALLYSASLIYDVGMQVITFLGNIPEFKLLDVHDRFVLTKYNLPLVVLMRICLNYDTHRDLVIDSIVGNREYAVACKQLARYCYGEQLDFLSNELFRSIKKITNDDPIILQLVLLLLTFVNGISIEDIGTNEELILLQSKGFIQK